MRGPEAGPAAPKVKKKPSKLPVHLRLPPRLENWQLFDKERLYDISAQEETLFALARPVTCAGFACLPSG